MLKCILKENVCKMKEIPIDINRYSKAIDGLRAVAVLAVIVNHFNNRILPGGYLGVDIFFVISGFVITNSLVKRKQTTVKTFFKSFYKRRIKRLVPALLFCFTVTAVLISFFSKAPKRYILTGLTSIPGFSNIALYLDSTDYWGSTSHYNPFTHTWSLGLEEQFYLIFPLSIWLLTKCKWSGLDLKRIKLFLIATCLISFFGYIHLYKTNPMMSYFLMPFRLWEIGIGCILYLQLKQTNGKFLKGIIARIPLLAIISLMTVSFLIPNDYGAYNTTFIVLLTAILIIKVKQKEVYGSGAVMMLLTSKTALYIGKISYSLYLWHWVVIVISLWTIGVTLTTLPIQLLLIIVFSTFSYHFIEEPLRHISWRYSWKAKSFLLSMFGVVLFFVFILISPAKNPFYLGNVKMLSTDLPENFDYSSKCSKIRTLGNSHSNHFLTMLKIISEKLRIELIYENHPQYIVIPSGNGRDFDKLEGVISSLNQNDILILSSRNHYLYQIPYLSNRGQVVNHSDEKKSKNFGLEIWLEELDAIIYKAQLKGINVVLFLPNVEFDSPVLKLDNCSPQWFRTKKEGPMQTVSREFLNSRFPKEFYSEVEKRALNNLNFFTFDPLPIYFKDSKEFSNCLDGIKLFNDTNHLTPEGSKVMLLPFYKFLKDNNLL